MKFKQSNPAIHRSSLDAELYLLRKEFEHILLVQAVVESYCDPCMLAKKRIYQCK